MLQPRVAVKTTVVDTNSSETTVPQTETPAPVARETEGARKLRELGFDPERGHAITMVVKSNNLQSSTNTTNN
ncbi:MAG: hypothetical protein AAB595_02620 [Patescibacteria group bacterium]